jgi:hypothetical protein
VSCPFSQGDYYDPDADDSGGDDSYPGAGSDHQPGDYTAPGAGIGRPQTVGIKVTVLSPFETVTKQPPAVTSYNPYPFTWTNRYKTNTIICEAQLLPGQHPGFHGAAR